MHWDTAVYHLTLPRLYLEAGGFAPLELSVYAVWPHGPQLLYAFGLLFGGPPLAKLFHFASGLLVLAGLHHALRRSGLPVWRCGAWVAIAGFAVHPLVLFEMQTAYVDLTQAFLFLAAFLARARDPADGEPVSDRRSGRQLAAAGRNRRRRHRGAANRPACFSCPRCLPALLPFWLARRRAGRGPPAPSACSSPGWLAPILVLWLPWIWRAWTDDRQSLLPLLLAPARRSRLERASWAEQFVAWQRGIGMGRAPLDYLLLPWRVLTEGDRGYAHFDGRLSAAADPPAAARPLAGRRGRPAAPAAAGARRRRALFRVCGRCRRSRCVSSSRSCPSPPSPPASPPPSSPATSAAARCSAAAVAALLPVAVFTDDPGLLRKGLQHAMIYRDAGFENDPWGAAPAFRNRLLELPENAKILLLNSNQGYYVPRPFLADSFFEASQIAAWLAGTPKSELPAKLAARGVTHVLLQRTWRVRYPQPLLELLAEQKQLRPIWSSPDGEWLLFELASS